MEKNYSSQALQLAVLVLLMLSGLSFLPGGMHVAGFDLRKMDIYSDVRDSLALEAESSDAPQEVPIDTFAYAPEDTAGLLPENTDHENHVVQMDSAHFIPQVDSVLFGRVIEDYTFKRKGLNAFFAAVDSISKGRSVRIAWYGDSFVEGDILIGDLRDSLQSVWGGAGVGFVPITSEVAQFKRTLKHQFKGWTAYSVIKKSPNRPKLGLNGYAYRPDVDARVHYEGAHYFHNTQYWNQLRFFYTSDRACNFVWQNNGVSHEESLPAKPDRLGIWKWQGPSTTAFDLRFPQPEGLMLYGATLENGPGIYIDNFSVRGNSGGPLGLLDPAFMREFDAIQRYDLIILQVGLNAVTNSLNNIRWYEAELDRTFKHLKACFPGKQILIVSVGDRGGKVGNEIMTMKGVPAIVKMQRQLARKHGFLFFDLFWGMGGPNTMPQLAYHRPRLANTDYTHLTHEGGKVVGIMFAKLFLQEKSLWQSKKNTL